MLTGRLDAHLSVEEDGGLICSVFNRTYLLNAIRIMHLNGNEFRLNNGRFRAFTFAPQAYPVVVQFDPYRWSRRHASCMIRWLIDSDMPGLWSMKGHPVSASRLDLQFSFENSTTAVYFALQWR